jgi:hypothetical protein
MPPPLFSLDGAPGSRRSLALTWVSEHGHLTASYFKRTRRSWDNLCSWEAFHLTSKWLKQLMRHLVFGVGSSVVAAGILIVIADNLGLGAFLRSRNLYLESWYVPLMWLPGFVIGFFANRKGRGLLPCMVWLPGLAWMLLFLKTDGRAQIFPRNANDCGTNECLSVVMVTYPFLNSVTYSLGALCGRLFGRSSQNTAARPTQDDKEPITLGLQ